MVLAVRHGLRVGVIFAVVLLFFALIGLHVVLAGVVEGFLLLPQIPAASAGMVGYLALLGLWAGAAAAPSGAATRWPAGLVAAAVAGWVAALPYALFAHALAGIAATGYDLRRYLFQLSPANIQAMQLGLDDPTGAWVSAAVLWVAACSGALVVHAAREQTVRARARRLWQATIDRWRSAPLAAALFQDNRARRGMLLAVAGGLALSPLFLSEYWNSTLGTVGIYMLMGLGLNIVVGLAGLLDLGYVAFFAVGAYTVGLLTAPRPLGIELSYWLVLPVAVLVAATAGVLLGLPVLRLRGDYLAIVTLGFGEIIRVLVMSQALAPVLGGPQGIRDIAGPALLGLDLSSQRAFVYLILVSIGLVIAVTRRLQDSRLGRSWEAMREDETVARATGINVYQAKLLAFAIGAAFAGLGGAIFASRNQYTGPEDHVLMVSINVLCLVIVGGMGSIPGIVAGAFVLKGLPEVLRPMQDYRLLAFGALLVATMIWRPQGLWPSRRRRLELSRETADGSAVVDPAACEASAEAVPTGPPEVARDQPRTSEGASSGDLVPGGDDA